jgi:hypothetical protein
LPLGAKRRHRRVLEVADATAIRTGIVGVVEDGLQVERHADIARSELIAHSQFPVPWPLIAGTDYRSLIEVTRGVELAAASGDPHPEAALHLVVALNRQSETIRQLEEFASLGLPGLRSRPLAWLGRSVALYADESPVWAELAAGGAGYDQLYRQASVLPIGAHIEVRNPLRLAAFLTSARAVIQQSAPGLTQWETLSHAELSYVKVSPSREAREESPDTAGLALYYATSGGSLTFTLNEGVMHRFLERRKARARDGKEAQEDEESGDGGVARDSGDVAAAGAAGETPAAAPRPWLGSSMALRADRRALDAIAVLTQGEHRRRLRDRSWSNLPILNEWKRRFPAEDPVELHERIWGVRLLCPGGGSYVWNAACRTMESTAYGHPGHPRAGPAEPLKVEALRSAALGVTFEAQGLRARAELERSTARH